MRKKHIIWSVVEQESIREQCGASPALSALLLPGVIDKSKRINRLKFV